jgi:hypothetical protein
MSGHIERLALIQYHVAKLRRRLSAKSTVCA